MKLKIGRLEIEVKCVPRSPRRYYAIAPQSKYPDAVFSSDTMASDGVPQGYKVISEITEQEYHGFLTRWNK